MTGLVSVTLIITVFNNAEILARCLEAFSKQTVIPDEIVIADDGSTDALVIPVIKSFIHKFFKVIHVSHLDHGYQRSKILNRAVISSEGDILIFTDSDCIPNKNFISDHKKLCIQGHFCLASRGCVKINHTKNFSLNLIQLSKYFLTNKISYRKRAIRSVILEIFKSKSFSNDILGANISCCRDSFISVNGFDEQYNGWGEEDVDFFHRMIHLGIVPIYPKHLCITYHLDHPLKSRNESNFIFLNQTIKNKSIRSIQGLDSNSNLPSNFSKKYQILS
jgi:glycosyltransferase involved in cell wall biosynthesis